MIPGLKEAPDWFESCDNCAYQEGRHYCLLYSKSVCNMDIFTCPEWENKHESDSKWEARFQDKKDRDQL